MEEGDLIYSQYGKSSIELYKEQGLLDNKTIFFHGVHLNEIDIDLLAEAGSSVVHCPVSNLSTGAGIAPSVSSMLEKGVMFAWDWMMPVPIYGKI